MKKIKLAYFGTPKDSAKFLEKILEDTNLQLDVKAVITQQDRKVGKKQVLTPSPVKEVANIHRIPVVEDLNKFNTEYDFGLLLFYGKILPKRILDLFKYGIWNIHFSLLPKYKGGAPYAQAIINGDTKTGISIFKMDEKVDHGPIISQKEAPIKPKERANELATRLTDISFEMLKSIFENYGDNLDKVPLREQDHSKETLTKLLTKDDGFMEISELKSQISNSPEKVFNLFRGLHPWPGVWTKVVINGQEKRLKLTDLDYESGKLIIKKVQLEGKNEVNFKQFNEVYKAL